MSVCLSVYLTHCLSVRLHYIYSCMYRDPFSYRSVWVTYIRRTVYIRMHAEYFYRLFQNNSIQVFTVREFFKLGTLQDDLTWMISTGNRYNLELLDRWFIQILATVDWAHANGLTLMWSTRHESLIKYHAYLKPFFYWFRNLSASNICVTDDGMDLRLVDYLPAGMAKEVIACVGTSIKGPTGSVFGQADR